LISPLSFIHYLNTFHSNPPLSSFYPFHCTGFQVLVGFKDRVRLYHVLLDRFKEYKEATLKNCRALKYSNGCHYWAGASGMTVVIYDSSSFSQLMAFQGHMMAIRRLVWAPGDQVLGSTFLTLKNLEISFSLYFCLFLFLCHVVLSFLSYLPLYHVYYYFRFNFSLLQCPILSNSVFTTSCLFPNSYPLLSSSILSSAKFD
jgi:hypothetical protein